MARGHERQHADGAATTADNLQRRGDDDGAGRRQLVEVAEAGEAELPRAVHRRVIREGGIEAARLPGVRPDGFDADAEDVSLVGEEFRRTLVEAGRVRAARILVEEVRDRRPLAPIRP